MTVRPLALVALLAPALALAAPAAASRPAAKPAAKGAAPARAAPRAAPAAPAGGPEIGGFVGYETADFSGLSLRVDGELPVRRLPSRLTLSLVGSLGYSRLTWSPGYGVKGTANVVKLVPALRATYPLARSFDVFADAGVGVAYVAARITVPPAFAAASFSDSTVNVMLRLGAGCWYHATERLKLGLLLELDPILGNFGFKSRGSVTAGSQTTFLAQVGAQVRI
jgi:opacity protein-like surface antigen